MAIGKFSTQRQVIWPLFPWIFGVSILIAVFILLTSGYSRAITTSDQLVITGDPLVLRAGATIGQTFTSHHAGLQGIDVFLLPSVSGSGHIRLHLRERSNTSSDIATTDLPLSVISHPDFYRFSFPPQAVSHQRDYYALMEIIGNGTAQVGRSSGETYLNGALYHLGQPLNAQMTFRLVFSAPYALELIVLPGEPSNQLQITSETQDSTNSNLHTIEVAALNGHIDVISVILRGSWIGAKVNMKHSISGPVLQFVQRNSTLEIPLSGVS